MPIDLNADSSWVAYAYETQFVADVLIEGWRRNEIVDVARSAVDNGGYDVVLQRGTAQRYVQFKQVTSTSSTSDLPVSMRLAAVLSGCVVVATHPPPGTPSIVTYSVFGGPTGAALDLDGLPSTKKERSASLPPDQQFRRNTRNLLLSACRPVSLAELYDFLFDASFVIPGGGTG